jgi:hypothetical protein
MKTKALEILETLQNHFLESVRFYLVGSSVVEAARLAGRVKNAIEPTDVDLVVESRGRFSRELTEAVFKSLFDVVEFTWPNDPNNYESSGVARRIIIKLVDQTSIDLLVLRPDVSIDNFCSPPLASGAHACAYITAALNGYYYLHCYNPFVTHIINGSETEIWGGTKLFVEKAIKRFNHVTKLTEPPKLKGRLALRLT